MSLIRVLYYQTIDEYVPFNEWLEGLRDRKGRNLIEQRVARIELGNFGDCRSIAEGVWEMRIHFGPGYRVYYMRDGAQVVVLLCGGDKGHQRRDIDAALGYAKDYWRRTK